MSMDLEAGTMPHSLDAERSVLGAILIDNDGFPLAASVLEPAQFYRVGHGQVFQAIASLLGAGEPADLRTVAECLRDRGQLDEIGLAYLGALVDGVPRATNVEYYAKRVRELADYREIIDASQRLQAAAHVAEQKPLELIGALNDRLARLGQPATARAQEWRISEETAKERARREARRRMDADDYGGAGEPVFRCLHDLLATPPPPLEYLVEGLQPLGSKVLFTAQAKAGKTTAVVNLIRSLVDGDPYLGTFPVHPRRGNTLLIDLEMSPNQLQRWFADLNIRNADRVKVVQLRGQARNFNILDPAIRKRWVEYLRREDVCYPILDNVRPVLDACGLKEQSEAGQFLNALDSLMAEAGIQEFMVIHHMGHSADRARGDSRLIDWPDVTWKMIRQRSLKTGEVEDPAAPRFFSAYGRDVEVSESQLAYELHRRQLTLTGGSRRESVSNAATSTILSVLGERELPKSVLEAEAKVAGLGRNIARDAIEAGLRSQVLIQTDGPNRSKLIKRGSGSPVRHRSPLAHQPTGSPLATSFMEWRAGGPEVEEVSSPVPEEVTSATI
ncbi:MAG: DnaB-like helicase N-terminal domain-containing protein [Acidobacteriota bacterium]|nr:DnaB-like helicase N-terminal domain-containing protein [Acidobacteriota bacterium]